MEFLERHKLVWEGLRQKFGERTIGIGVILLYSGVEYRLMAS